MSETKFTPGPWRCEGFEEHLGYDCMTAGVRSGPAVLDGRDYGQKSCHNMKEEARDVMMADAALIAAAPDLYAALMKAKAELEEYEQAATGGTYNSPLLNAALAKARGEA